MRSKGERESERGRMMKDARGRMRGNEERRREREKESGYAGFAHGSITDSR